MAARVFLHIGPHKTGTTYLQAVLGKNKAKLAEDGVLYPGRRYAEQRRAVQSLLFRGTAEAHGKRWQSLVSEVKAWPGHTVIISQEGLAQAEADVVRAAVQSLEPLEVHVVYAIRDLTRVLPGSWQTRVRNGHPEPWAEFIASVRQGPEERPRFWNGQDPRIALKRWAQAVPKDRIQVVTVPPPGSPRQLLWERFAEAMGLDAGRYSLDVPPRMESLGTAETEVLRRISARLSKTLSHQEFMALVARLVTRRVLIKSTHQVRISLPRSEQSWVRTYAEEFIDFLRSEGYPIVGDLREILPTDNGPASAAPDEVDADQALDVAVEVIAELLMELRAAPGDQAADAR